MIIRFGQSRKPPSAIISILPNIPWFDLYTIWIKEYLTKHRFLWSQ